MVRWKVEKKYLFFLFASQVFFFFLFSGARNEREGRLGWCFIQVGSGKSWKVIKTGETNFTLIRKQKTTSQSQWVAKHGKPPMPNHRTCSKTSLSALLFSPLAPANPTCSSPAAFPPPPLPLLESPEPLRPPFVYEQRRDKKEEGEGRRRPPWRETEIEVGQARSRSGMGANWFRGLTTILKERRFYLFA